MTLIRVANILPKGMYVEQAVKVAKRELKLECDYTYEANAQMRFRCGAKAPCRQQTSSLLPSSSPGLLLTFFKMAKSELKLECDDTYEVKSSAALLHRPVAHVFQRWPRDGM